MYTTVIKLHENGTKTYECINFVTTKPLRDFGLSISIWLPMLLLVLLIVLIVLLVYRRLPRLREEVLKKIGMYDPVPESQD